MKLTVNKEAGALNLRLDKSRIVGTEEASPGVMLDFNEANKVVGVEMLYLTRRFPGLDLGDVEVEGV